VFQSVGKQRLRDCEFVSALVYCGVELTLSSVAGRISSFSWCSLSFGGLMRR
jgi:hypothetical protein